MTKNPRQHQHHRRLARAARRNAAHADHRTLQPVLLQPSPLETSAASSPAPPHTAEPAATASGLRALIAAVTALSSSSASQRLYRPRRRPRLRLKHRRARAPRCAAAFSRFVNRSTKRRPAPPGLARSESPSLLRIVSTISRKFSNDGPITTGTPNCAGSSGLCPPFATRLPPTNATAASQYTDARSPIVSSRRIAPGRDRLRSLAQLARSHRSKELRSSPSAPATSSNRSGCRGAISSTASRHRSASDRRPRRQQHLSPRPPACSRNDQPSPAAAALPNQLRHRALAPRACTSYFRFPVTLTRSAGAPICTSRSRRLLALRQKQRNPLQQRPPQPPQPHIPRKRPVRDPRIHHRHRNAAASRTPSISRGHNSLSISTSIFGRSTPDTAAPPTRKSSGR